MATLAFEKRVRGADEQRRLTSRCCRWKNSENTAGEHHVHARKSDLSQSV